MSDICPEELSKIYGVKVLLGEDEVNRAGDSTFVELDLIEMQDKEKPVRVYILLGEDQFSKKDNFKKWKSAHEGMLAAYRAGDYDCSAQDLKEARGASEGHLNVYYDLYAVRIGELIKNA